MEEYSKSLALQYDYFINNALKFLDTSTERDYLLKLKIIDELLNNIKEGENDKEMIKKQLEAVQDECSKLSYKLKNSARLLHEVQVGKEKVELEKETLKLQLEQLHNAFKKPDTAQSSQINHSHSSRSNHLQKHENKLFDTTDALLSDLSYSHSDDSSNEKLMNDAKHKLTSTITQPKKELNIKTCEIKNVNTNGGQIIATTTLTMDMGSLNAKSIIKTHPPLTTKASLISLSSDSVETSINSELDEELHTNANNIRAEKKHRFVQKMVVIPEICGQCFKKVKFNNYMVKCLDCKTVAHMECQDLITVKCGIDQNKVDALNCSIPPLIVYCTTEIEKRGLDTVGLYRISGSDKDVKILSDKFRKGVPNLSEVDIHVLCSCVKDYIRKNHLISQNTLFEFIDALKKNGEMSSSLNQIISDLPSNNRNVLAYLILHLKKVANSSKCNMDFNDIAIVFEPIIIGLSCNSLDNLHNKSGENFKVLTEMLMLPEQFWLSFIKTDITSSNELLYSTPARNESQTPGSSSRFFSSGIKRRILNSPKKNKAAKQVKTK